MKSEIRNPNIERTSDVQTNTNVKNPKFKKFWSLEHLILNIVSNFDIRASKFKMGFTLLEVLVVIAIIAILITLGITSFSTVQKKGRDAKRKSDLKEVQTALEQYYSVCAYNYPVPTGFYSQGIICIAPNVAIMPTVPSDPRGTPYYCPTPVSSKCSSSIYTICAQLESESTPEYCLSNQQ